jgi:hypothetical protein
MYTGWIRRQDCGPWERACTGRTLQDCADKLRVAALAAGVPQHWTTISGTAAARPIAKVFSPSPRRRVS